jgi:D-alanine-D-alanine ligase
MGGQSSEHDVSIASGSQVLAALDRERYDVTPVLIARDGAWLLGAQPPPVSLAAAPDGGPPRAPEPDPGTRTAVTDLATAASKAALDELRTGSAFDIVFLALHGACGEDGTIQGLLELAGIAYTGSGVLASALAMDKVKTKEIFSAHGIPVARHAVIVRRAWREAAEAGREALLSAAIARAGLPCVVKPVVGGSSVATSLCATSSQARAGVELALEADVRAMLEERLEGPEVTCAVLGGGPHEAAEAMPVTEIVPMAGSAFFDFHAKYTKGACDEITPARISAELTRRVQEQARAAHEALGCEGMSRTDFIIRAGVPTALETNTIPGMTATSLLPQAADAAGIPFPRLLDRLIASALRRRQA